ncbi:hypothetical protein MED222_05090 [Vibrio sp. MED222]|nr:hypothetical protein MED222_05090 [Vibrio sp. MED222]
MVTARLGQHRHILLSVLHQIKCVTQPNFSQHLTILHTFQFELSDKRGATHRKALCYRL